MSSIRINPGANLAARPMPNMSHDINKGDIGLSDAERYLWVAWLLLILIVSIPGNIVILVSSLKYRAIKLDKITGGYLNLNYIY